MVVSAGCCFNVRTIGALCLAARTQRRPGLRRGSARHCANHLCRGGTTAVKRRGPKVPRPLTSNARDDRHRPLRCPALGLLPSRTRARVVVLASLVTLDALTGWVVLESGNPLPPPSPLRPGPRPVVSGRLAGPAIVAASAACGLAGGQGRGGGTPPGRRPPPSRRGPGPAGRPRDLRLALPQATTPNQRGKGGYECSHDHSDGGYHGCDDDGQRAEEGDDNGGPDGRETHGLALRHARPRGCHRLGRAPALASRSFRGGRRIWDWPTRFWSCAAARYRSGHARATSSRASQRQVPALLPRPPKGAATGGRRTRLRWVLVGIGSPEAGLFPLYGTVGTVTRWPAWAAGTYQPSMEGVAR
jgi:hypothetical protein